MVGHHAKDKGDLGVAKAHADLVSQGFTVLFPATEHALFDLVAYADGVFHRLQVKCPSTSALLMRSASIAQTPTSVTTSDRLNFDRPPPCASLRARTANT